MRAEGHRARSPRKKVLRNPSLKSWLVSVAVETWRSRSAVSADSDPSPTLVDPSNRLIVEGAERRHSELARS